jgi:transcriptional regulator with XRE-family HTH domain
MHPLSNYPNFLRLNGFMTKSLNVDKTTKEFGSRIRGLRKELGMSQEDLGDIAGLHRTYIGHLERGEVNPSLINILRVAKALKTDPSSLVSGLKIPRR